MGTGTAVSTGDLITAAKMNLKLETLSDSDEISTFTTLRFLTDSGGLPAGTVNYIGRDNTGDVTVNALSTKTFNVAVAGTDVARFAATIVTLVLPTVNFTAAAGAVIGTTDNNIITFKTNAINKLVINTALGSLQVNQTTGNYTLTFSDPAGAVTITFPVVTGTLATLAGTESLTNKTITSAAMSGTMTGAHTYSGALTLTATPLNFTAAATFVLGTTDAYAVAIKTQGTTRWTFALGSYNLTAGAAADIVGQAATASMIRITDGTTALASFDSRATTDNVIMLTLTPTAPTIAGVGGTTFSAVSHVAFTFTTSTTTTITALNGLGLNLGVPTIAQSGGAVTVTTASTLMVGAPAAGASVTITNRYIINTNIAGCFCTAAGVWTDTSLRASKQDIRPVDFDQVLLDIQRVEAVTFRKIDSSDGGFLRYGVVADDVPDFLAMPGRQGIGSIYLAGAAFAGVQALLSKVQGLERELAELKASR